MWRKLLFLFRRRRFDRELEEEIQLHLQMKMQGGMDHAAACRSFGNVTLLKEVSREMWGWRSLEKLAQDLRYALRQLRSSPGLTTVITLSLALGIGANTAIFSLIDAVMLKTLPVKNPEQLVLLNWASWKWPSGMSQSGHTGSDKAGRQTSPSFSYPFFDSLRLDSSRDRNQIFSSVFALAPLGFDKANITISVGGQASLTTGEMVSGSYFSGLGVSPAIGRAITEEDEKPGAPRVAVISHGYWSRKFGRDQSVVGTAVTLNGAPFTIVGVAPPEFFGVQPGRAPEIWIAIGEEPGPWGSHPQPGRSLFTDGNWWWLEIMGRLKPGVTTQQARAALDVAFQQSISAGLHSPPKPEDVPHLELMPAAKGLDNLRRRFSAPLFILMIVVGLVLLIACSNVATLLLARATTRQREMGVRLAIGAGRTRLIRQLLTESILLAAIGGALGLLFAYWGSRALLLAMASGRNPVALDLHTDPAVLAFTAAVSLLTGILFGLAPAFRATRVDLTPTLKESAASISARGGRSRLGLGKLLVASQVALSLPLLIGAALFVRTLANLENQNLGFNRHNLLLFGIDATQSGYKGARLTNLYGQFLERIQRVPGVASAGLSSMTLISNWKSEGPIEIAGYRPNPGQSANVQWNTVGPGFFETMGIRVLLGRAIDWRDNQTSSKVAVVNEAMVRHFFGDRNPIGQKFHFQRRPGPADQFEIVGVVQNAKFANMRDEPPRTAYLAFDQTQPRAAHFEVRTAGDPAALIPTVRRLVHELEPNLPLSDVKTQNEQIGEALFQERLFARISAFFGVLALLLACIGLHGLMAYGVTRRTNEIGIRLALGAHSRQVLWMVLRESLWLVITGIAVGIPLTMAATRLVRGLLYGLSPADPTALLTATAIMMAVAALAGYLPARRASRLDPMVALRYE